MLPRTTLLFACHFVCRACCSAWLRTPTRHNHIADRRSCILRTSQPVEQRIKEALKKHQYPKGVSGNVLGRKPNYESMKKELSKLGQEVTMNYRDEPIGTRKEQVLLRIWKDAIGGDLKKIQLLAWLGCLD